MCKSRSIQLSDWPLLNSIDTACKLQAKLEKVISSCKLTHTDIKTFSLPWGCSMTKLLGVRSWHITSTISALLALSEKTLQGFYMWQFDYTLGYHCEAHSQLHVCWLHDNLFLILSQLSFTLSYVPLPGKLCPCIKLVYSSATDMTNGWSKWQFCSHCNI